MLVPFVTFSQGSPPECSTPETAPNLTELESLRVPDYTFTDFHLKVYVHVLTHSQKGAGQTVLGINESMKWLYNEFDDLGIYLVWDGEVDYILDNDWFDVPSQHDVAIFAHNYHTDGIDIYLGNSISPHAFGRAYGIGEGSAFIVSGHSTFLEENVFDFWAHSPVIVHEMGHVLYLYHTFHGTSENTGGCPECLDVIDSQRNCGDFIVDTPPDNKTGINLDCVYTEGGQDVCGTDFNPLTNNYMSAAPFDCRDSFTHGQKRRMKNAIGLISKLQATQLQTYTYIRGKSLLCDADSYTIYSNDTSNLIIENSNNITVIIGVITGTQIELEIIYNDFGAAEGQAAWIEVKRNGLVQARKDIWLGYPQAMADDGISGDDDVYPGDPREYSIAAQLEGTTHIKGEDTYHWLLPGYDPVEEEPFTSYDEWKYNYLTKHDFVAHTQVGGCSGELLMYGINQCGNGELKEGDGLDVYVNNGSSDCPDETLNIVYYPNPASSLLAIDLSLQAYKVFDVVVYNDLQLAVYTDQSTNVVKTIDVFNLPNGTYYLHIYDNSTLILNKILIINH